MNHQALPPLACDCHVHLFGPLDRYPFDAARVYTPGDADEATLNTLHAQLAIARVVLIQPSVYGTDNSRLVDGLARLGRRARAVAVIDQAISNAELSALHDAGVRGVRVNIATHGMNDPEKAWALIAPQAQRVAPLGWHVQVLTKAPVIAALADRLATLPCPLVIDHFGLPDLAKGFQDRDFQSIVALVCAGHALVKLSAMERLTGTGRLALLQPFVEALANANIQRLLWGSDWPHTGGGRQFGQQATDVEPFQDINDGEAVAALSSFLSDTAARHGILQDNPARLYGFDEGHTP